MVQQAQKLIRFLISVYSLDIEKDVGLLVENRPDVTDRYRRVVHLIPLTIACLGDTTERLVRLNTFAILDHIFMWKHFTFVSELGLKSVQLFISYMCIISPIY